MLRRVRCAAATTLRDWGAHGTFKSRRHQTRFVLPVHNTDPMADGVYDGGCPMRQRGAAQTQLTLPARKLAP